MAATITLTLRCWGKKGCVGHEKTHLAGCRENDVIRKNPGFSWDEAEKGVFEKEVPNF